MVISTAAASSPAFPANPKKKAIAKLVMATSIGNALEWYDIAVYGYFAVYIS
jgi:MHS family proline/betaine transporter-like MFS transporter